MAKNQAELTVKGSPDAINRLMRSEASANEVRALVDLPVLNAKPKVDPEVERIAAIVSLSPGRALEAYRPTRTDRPGRYQAQHADGSEVTFQLTDPSTGEGLDRSFDIIWR